MLLQWYASLVKYADYKGEFARVCELLKKKSKCDKVKKQRFIQVVNENRVYVEDLSELLDALL